MSLIKNKWMVLMLLLSSSGVLGKAAFAEEPPAPQTVYTQLGLALPLVGDLEDISDAGLFFGAQVMHPMDAYASYGVGVSYYSFGKESKDQVDTQVSVLTTMVMAHRAVASQGSAKPYVKTGLGFSRTQVNINQSNSTGPAVLQGTNQEDISPTLLFGLGFDMPVSRGAMLGFSVDYQHFFFRVGDVNGGGSLNLLVQVRM